MGNKKTPDSVLSPKEKLRQQLEVVKSSTSTHARITKLVQRDRIELSFAQRRLWFLSQYAGGQDVTYNMPLALRLKGNLDTAALARALNTLVERHESLRTHFQQLPAQTELEQVITEAPDFEMPVVTVEAEEEQEHIEANSRHAFNLSTGPLFRASLLHISGQDHVLLICMHHIISDGWSLGILTRELSTLYQAYQQGKENPLSALPIQYADYAHWQREWLQGEQLTRQLDYWREQLTGVPPLLDLPLNHPRPAIQTFNGAVEVFQIDKKMSKKLRALSQGEEVTLFMLLLAVFNVLLWRYSGQDDIVVGTPVANRNHSELEGLIGFFVNTLVLRHRPKSEISFRDFLNQVRQTTLGAYSHQDIPFEHLVEVLNPERSASYSPLFQVMFQLHNQLRGESGFALPEVEISPAAQPQEISKFDLTLSINETEEGLLGSIEYNTNLFDQPTIGRMAGHFQQLVQGIVANPNQTLSALPLLTPKEHHQIVHEWNDTASEFPHEKCIHELFEEQAARTPHNVAVVFEDRRLTYAELNAQANQLAHYLIERGVKPDTLVGLFVERSLEMIIGLLGILKAGGAYVPLDPEYPEARTKFMIEDTAISIILTQLHFQRVLPSGDWQIVCLDEPEMQNTLQCFANNNPAPEVLKLKSRHLAYAIYTSGSTGKPKGVLIEHKSVVNSTLSRFKLYREHLSGFALLSSYSFDSSVAGIFWTLLSGAKLCLIDSLDLMAFQKKMRIEAISHILIMPSLYKTLLRSDFQVSDSLNTVIVAGEKCESSLVAEHNLHPKFKMSCLFNEYGPTESCVWSTFYKCENNVTETIPIGKPIINIETYILSKERTLVPIGIPGELYIGGVGLARGVFESAEIDSREVC